MGDTTTQIQRLNKQGLGRHAYEEHMPDRVSTLISAEDDQNSHGGIIHNLARLLQHDKNVAHAWLCTVDVLQIHKLAHEGGHFCGYRNIQMQWSALAISHQEHLPFTSKPTIPQLQDMIEAAWDAGFNSHGRTLTGGIRSTRKHIGPSEAEALLLSMKFSCTGSHFEGKTAYEELLDHVATYFSSSGPANSITTTDRPPIFLQRPAHSITIVGIEQFTSGERGLLVFDPAWRPPSGMCNPPADSQCSGLMSKYLLSRYRKSARSMRRFHEFETLAID